MEEDTHIENKEKFNLGRFHDKHYKTLLLIPLILLMLSIGYLFYFNYQTGDFISKDISLTGGTSITIQGSLDIDKIQKDLSESLEDLNIRSIYDIVTNEQKAVIIQTRTDGEETKTISDFCKF